MDRPIKELSDELLKPSDMNLWFARYNSKHPDLADDYFNGVVGTGISWERLFVYFAATTNGFRDPYVDPATAILDWKTLETMNELPGLDLFDALWHEWTEYRDGLLQRRRDGGVPLPKPKPPEPKPPEPKPEPKPPTGWWDCATCGERDNPPLGERCLKCHAVRPGYEPKPEEPKPEEPKPPSVPDEWKSKLKWLGSLCGLLLGLGFVIKYIPGAAAVWVYLEPILRFIEKLFS
jgi:hypothetical protein